MGDAKAIVLRPISRGDADRTIKRLHYSGKVVNNSQLSIGVFYQGKLEGAMQFGPSMDKRQIQGLVANTGWNDFIELNRMAFSDALPRNSESRAIAVAMRLLRKHAPHLQWVVTFADATQCGDGTIYRASGFVLTGIKKNNQIWIAPSETGAREECASLENGSCRGEQGRANILAFSRLTLTKGEYIGPNGSASMRHYQEAGFLPLEGFQLRYIYFLDPSARNRLTVPALPFSLIKEMGACMYKGQKLTTCDRGETDSASRTNEETGGASPTRSLSTF